MFLEPIGRGAQIQERADQHALGLGTRFQRARAVGGAHHDRLALDALGRELARRIAEIEVHAAAKVRPNPEPFAFTGQDHVWPFAADRQRLGYFSDRNQSLGSIAEGTDHGGGRAQDIEHHANRAAEVALL